MFPPIAFNNAYAILGYGSLVWDLEILEPHVRLPWVMGGGPLMPMEFSRISPKRKLGLVVVLDPENGELCPTHALVSRRKDVHAVAEDLCARERSPSTTNIGAVCTETGFVRSRHDHVATRVSAWCAEVGARGAVWTDLPRNFHEHTDTVFSLRSAHAYLRTLSGASLAEAIRYIDNAPPATDTPLRRMLEIDSWWQSLPRGLDSRAK